MKNNVGTIDAAIRLTCGFFGLAWSTSKMVNHPYKNRYQMVSMLSAMKIAEGITHYCPIFDLLEVNTNKCNCKSNEEDSIQQSK